jgi:hypothetical protein
MTRTQTFCSADKQEGGERHRKMMKNVCCERHEPISWIARRDGCMAMNVDFLLNDDRRA